MLLIPLTPQESGVSVVNTLFSVCLACCLQLAVQHGSFLQHINLWEVRQQNTADDLLRLLTMVCRLLQKQQWHGFSLCVWACAGVLPRRINKGWQSTAHLGPKKQLVYEDDHRENIGLDFPSAHEQQARLFKNLDISMCKLQLFPETKSAILSA